MWGLERTEPTNLHDHIPVLLDIRGTDLFILDPEGYVQWDPLEGGPELYWRLNRTRRHKHGRHGQLP